MITKKAIAEYIKCKPLEKCNDMETLHKIIMQLMPTNKLWFFDGKDTENKIISNPNIGYGIYNIRYVNGSSK